MTRLKRLWNSDWAEKIIAAGIAVVAILLAASAIYRAHQVSSVSGIPESPQIANSMTRADFHPIPNPVPNMTAGEVLSVILTYFRSPDYPRENFGVDVAWRFASPENRLALGSEAQLQELLSSETYSPLVGFNMAYVGEPEIGDDRIRYPVLLEHAEDSPALFYFHFVRQRDGDFRDCWLTEGVERISFDPEMAQALTERHS